MIFTPHVRGIEDIIKGKRTPTRKRKLHSRLTKNVDPRGVSLIELPITNLLLFEVHHMFLARGDMPCYSQINPPIIGWRNSRETLLLRMQYPLGDWVLLFSSSLVGLYKIW
ncbi:hypothetical protein AMTR_s00005p00199350 [Amborella trichopoda]|uniref:Uncharacterized protein n=1 Tax=Amborella trichopoda TaxID=13333 RepID=W1PFS6_AMBTC|nr:hypothetical protein AMTR_s00005p00199350 [Amborella trichopoda]